MLYTSLCKRTKKMLYAFLFSFCILFQLFMPAMCMASETQVANQEVRIITVAELDRLDNIFSQLSQTNGRLQNELTDSKTVLLKSQTELQKARQELLKLQMELSELKRLSANQETLLQKANKSFGEYATEVKRERLRIKAQRTLWQGISLVIAGLAITK